MAWAKALNIIKKQRVPSAQDEHSIIFLISFLNKISINKLYQDWKKIINFNWQQLAELVIRYLKGEPLAYLTNEVEFCERIFYIDSRAFIPRIETAELTIRTIDLITEHFSNQKDINIIEIGTGSGAIAITLALAFPDAYVYASDISNSALAVAKINQKKHHVLNLDLLVGDGLEPFVEKGIKADIVIANPPYIAKNDPDLDWSVRDYEPAVALYWGDDGLGFYRLLFANWTKILNVSGLISLEIGYKQRNALVAIAKNYFLEKNISFGRDHYEWWRFMFIWCAQRA